MKSSQLVLAAGFLFTSLAVARAQVAPTFLPGDRSIGPSAANQQAPALSRGGEQILAVWADGRTSPSTTGQQSGQDVFATRLDASGAPIDVVPFPVTMAGGDQKSPRVAWNGSHWLVVWVGPLSTPGYFADAILAARVAPDGGVVDAVPIVLQTELGSGSFGDVASDGNGWAVFYTGWSGATSQVLGKRIAANGAVLDASAKVIAAPGSSPNTPFGVTAEWAGNRYLVAWSQWSAGLDDVRGQLADGALVPQGVPFQIASSSDYEVNPDLASNGSQFFAVWDRYNNCCVGGASKAYGTRVTTAGATLDGPFGVAIYDTNGYGFQGCEPAVAWDGAQWVASWTEPAVGGLRVNAGRISAAGVVLDFNGFEVDPLPVRQEASAVVARPGGGSLVVWQDSRVLVGQPNDIHAARVDGAGIPLALGSIADSAAAQVEADAAKGPDGGALLAWASLHSGLSRVLVQRVNLAGVPVAMPLELAAAPIVNGVRAAWNGTSWLVVWDEYPNGVKGLRLDADLAPLDPSPFAVMQGYSPDVAAQGGTFLVTALIPEANPEFVDVFSRRVSAATGALLDPAPVFVGMTYATAQRVEAFEGGFLVAWEMHPTHDNPWSNVGLRYVSALNVPGAQKILSSGSTYNARPALAVGDGSALVVWQKNPSSSISEDIVARLVVGSALTLPGANVTVSAAALSQQLPAVAWDGTQYLVTWQDTRANAATYLFDKRSDVYAARVSAAGNVLDPAGIPLATDFAPEAWPVAVGLGVGTTLAAWSDFQPQAPYAAYRVGFTLLGGTSPWVNLGNGLAGGGGVPVLLGAGSLQGGTTATLSLSNAAASAPVVFVIGASPVFVPFIGGTLVPSPDVILAGLSTNSAGALQLAGTWPPGVPAGAEFYFQAWIQDSAAIFGTSASNGLEAVAP